jgi:kynurenine/2-aminoadipate aminotransferase
LLEDDPYYYLQFHNAIPSYFSLDVDGRVLRFDSLSKIISAGFRIGWVSGASYLIDKIVLHSMASNLHVSGVSQALSLTIFKYWGIDGFLAHTAKVAEFYKSRRDSFLKICDKHLKGLCNWTIPSAGMFVWFDLKDISDSASLINEKAVEKKVYCFSNIILGSFSSWWCILSQWA